MEQENKNEITQGGSNLPAAGPGRGFESGIDQSDIIFPRATLIQPMSADMLDPELHFKMGEIINNLTKLPLPERFIPIFCFKNYIRFNPRSAADPAFNPDYAPGKLIWRTADKDDPRVIEQTKFGENGEKPLAMTMLNFFSLFPDAPMPIVVSFSKTSYAVGRRLLSLCRFSGGDMFSRQYKLGSQIVPGASGTYAVFTVSPAGAATPQEIEVCEKLWREFSLRAAEIKTHDDESDADIEGGESQTDNCPF